MCRSRASMLAEFATMPRRRPWSGSSFSDTSKSRPVRTMGASILARMGFGWRAKQVAVVGAVGNRTIPTNPKHMGD